MRVNPDRTTMKFPSLEDDADCVCAGPFTYEVSITQYLPDQLEGKTVDVCVEGVQSTLFAIGWVFLVDSAGMLLRAFPASCVNQVERLEAASAPTEAARPAVAAPSPQPDTPSAALAQFNSALASIARNLASLRAWTLTSPDWKALRDAEGILTAEIDTDLLFTSRTLASLVYRTNTESVEATNA